jgi:hypothetical protein
MGKTRYFAILVLIGMSSVAGTVIGGKLTVAQSAPPQSIKAVEAPSAQKWEYRVVNVGYDKAEAIANTLGEQGFEMLNFTKSPYSKESTFIFKRPKAR